MVRSKAFTLVELLVVIAVIVILAGIMIPVLFGARSEAHKSQCRNNLRQLSDAMQTYAIRFSDGAVFAEPSDDFRGDAWLATLYWTGLVDGPEAFRCPASNTNSSLLPDQMPDDLDAAAIPPNAMSYAGLSNSSSFSGQRTTRFNTSAISSSLSAMASDACHEGRNHEDGIVVVYFGGHVRFVSLAPGSNIDYEYIGNTNAGIEELRYLDPGH